MQSKKTFPCIGSSRGVFHLHNSEKNYHLEQFQPNLKLQPFVEQFWHVKWNLRPHQVHTQKNLPQANMHFTFEGNQALVYGPVTSSFTRTLAGDGNIFGIKFHVGAFFPIIKRSTSDFTDRVINLSELFENEAVEETTAALSFAPNLSLSSKLSSEKSIVEKIKIAEHFLQELLFGHTSPFLISDIEQTSKQIMQVRNIVKLIDSNHTITKVAQLADHTGLSERTLQRLFKSHVGLSPKWLIRKYRIHELLDRLETNIQAIDWQQIILDLDYVDQAHLINDFKSFIGCSPQQYLSEKSNTT